jgi:hypothetical protein
MFNDFNKGDLIEFKGELRGIQHEITDGYIIYVNDDYYYITGKDKNHGDIYCRLKIPLNDDRLKLKSSYSDYKKTKSFLTSKRARYAAREKRDAKTLKERLSKGYKRKVGKFLKEVYLNTNTKIDFKYDDSIDYNKDFYIDYFEFERLVKKHKINKKKLYMFYNKYIPKRK